MRQAPGVLGPFRRHVLRLLKENELSILALARGTGTDYATTWHWLKGKKYKDLPRGRTLEKIARFLHVSIGELVAPDEWARFQQLLKYMGLLELHAREIRADARRVVLTGRARAVFQEMRKEARKYLGTRRSREKRRAR
ncbi:MAG: helix-turn-helix transcriptional regulator [Planctomycetota bacterium]